MKYLGIDYGRKRTGVALSDDNGRIAFPHSVLATSKQLASTIANIAQKEGVTIFIVGRSITGTGEENPVMKDIRSLVDELCSYGQVFFEDERYTSQYAARVQGEHDLHDASAAALILQGYLDRVNRTPAAADPYTVSSQE